MARRRGIAEDPPVSPYELNRETAQARGLIAWYPTRINPATTMGVLRDLTGNYAPGVLTTAPPWAVDNIMGSHLSFAAAGPAYVDLGDMLLLPATDLTICMWAVITETATNGIWFCWDASSNWRCVFSKLQGWATRRVGSTTRDDYSPAGLVATTTTWAHFAFVYQMGTGYKTIYKNGVTLGTKNADHGAGALNMTSVNNIWIARASDVTQSMGFKLGSFSVYNRALSPAMIMALSAPQTRNDLYAGPRRRYYAPNKIVAALAGDISLDVARAMTPVRNVTTTGATSLAMARGAVTRGEASALAAISLDLARMANAAPSKTSYGAVTLGRAHTVSVSPWRAALGAVTVAIRRALALVGIEMPSPPSWRTFTPPAETRSYTPTAEIRTFTPERDKE